MPKKNCYPYEVEPGLIVLAPESEPIELSVSEEVRVIMEGVNLLNRWSSVPQDPFDVLQRLWYYENENGDWFPIRITVDTVTTP